MSSDCHWSGSPSSLSSLCDELSQTLRRRVTTVPVNQERRERRTRTTDAKKVMSCATITSLLEGDYLYWMIMKLSRDLFICLVRAMSMRSSLSSSYTSFFQSVSLSEWHTSHGLYLFKDHVNIHARSRAVKDSRKYRRKYIRCFFRILPQNRMFTDGFYNYFFSGAYPIGFER